MLSFVANEKSLFHSVSISKIKRHEQLDTYEYGSRVSQISELACFALLGLVRLTWIIHQVPWAAEQWPNELMIGIIFMQFQIILIWILLYA